MRRYLAATLLTNIYRLRHDKRAQTVGTHTQYSRCLPSLKRSLFPCAFPCAFPEGPKRARVARFIPVSGGNNYSK